MTRTPLQDRIAAAQKRARASREKKFQRAKERGMSAKALKQRWDDVTRWRYEGEDVHVETEKEGVILLQCYRRHKRRNYEVDFCELMEWSIENWRMLMDTLFGSMRTEKPDLPAIRFFVKCLGSFLQAYDEKAYYDELSRMTPKERFVAAEVRQGVDRKVAEKAAEEKYGRPARRRTRPVQQLHQERVQKKEPEVRTRKRKRPTGNGEFGEWK